jgi:hypothetical protein
MERSKKGPGVPQPGPNSHDACSLGAYVRHNHLVFDARSEVGALIYRKTQFAPLMERSDAPRVGQRPWGNHHDRYYSGDERGGGAFHTASKVLNSSNVATSDCRHRSKRDDRLDVSTGLWICQTSLSADLIDPAPGQMVSLAKSAKRPQGSTAIKPVEFPVRRTTCPAHLGRNLKASFICI